MFIGDIVGRPGRNAVKKVLPELKAREHIDYCFANGENLAAGKGMTYAKYSEMIEAGIDYFTSGNHIWNNADIVPHLNDSTTKVLRPLNYDDSEPGRGLSQIGDIVLINLEGRVFMKEELADPFLRASQTIERFSDKIIVIDFHAEATSEKIALGYFLDGKISALVGTHTHVQTADEKILEKGTAYITDIGMTGPVDSVLGVKKEIIIEKFLTSLPQSHKVASGDTIFNAVIINIDTKTKKATEIKRINQLINA